MEEKKTKWKKVKNPSKKKAHIECPTGYFLVQSVHMDVLIKKNRNWSSAVKTDSEGHHHSVSMKDNNKCA